MKPSSTDLGLPSTGTVLGFVIDSLGVPKKTEGYDHWEIRRLKKGGHATEKHWEVVRKVIVAVVASFTDAQTARQTVDEVFRQKVSTPIKRIHWQMQRGLLVPVPEFEAPMQSAALKWNAAGELENLCERLVHDWVEFIQCHEYLTTKCGSTESPRTEAVFQWASAFVVPFLTMNLVEYRRNDPRLESGMPGGRLWYLPLLVFPKDADLKPRFKWPVNTVLEWWEDLLGVSLESLADKLCPLDETERIADRFRELGGFDDEERQVRAWLNEDRPPKLKTITHWCAQKWEYKGTFVDDTSEPLTERWRRCREFLVRKGLHDTTGNWLDEARGTAREVLEKQYRGEPLEKEIPPFKQTSFAAFFESADPIAAGLPVEKLIPQIAERYAQPTNEQLKARFMIAAAFQRAFNQAVESLGVANTIRICDWFQQVYCFLTDLHNRAEPETRAELLRLLREAPESQGGLRFACEWLFDEASWLRLPAEIDLLIKP